LWDLLFFFQNYHSEHHDFPYLPHTELRNVRRVASKHYLEEIRSHHGIFPTMIEYFKLVIRWEDTTWG